MYAPTAKGATWVFLLRTRPNTTSSKPSDLGDYVPRHIGAAQAAGPGPERRRTCSAMIENFAAGNPTPPTRLNISHRR